MIDLKAARADPEAFRAALVRKGDQAAQLFDELIAADARWLELIPQVDALRSKTKLKGKPTPAELEELKQVKEDLKRLEDELSHAERDRQALLDRVPNLPDVSAPDGFAEEDAVEIRRVGEPPSFDFPVQDHVDLAQAHGWIDLERGARVSGSRFVYRTGEVALLELALYRFALDRLVQKGFDKVEMFVFTFPEASRDEHERLLEIEEELVQELQLPYRVVNIAAGDLGASAAKKYDIEAWFPGQERWREITSTSNTTDYQARRLEIRYRRGDRQLETVHTLNGTAVTARAMTALMENFQDEGGSISVPEPLWDFGAPQRLG